MSTGIELQWPTLAQVAEQAEVEPRFVERLVAAGAIEPEGAGGYSETDVRRVRLLHAWDDAGLPAERVMELVRSGDLSVAWLDTPAVTRAGRRAETLEELCEETGTEVAQVQALYEALGFAPPAATEHIREGDRELVE